MARLILRLINSFNPLLPSITPPSYGIPVLPSLLRLLLLGPEARTDAEYHQQEHHEKRRGPRPARRGPRVGMIDEHRDEGLEEVRLDRVGQSRAILQVLPVQDEGIGATGGLVRLVEALALRAGDGIAVGVIEDARSPTGAVAGAKHIGTDAAESRAGHCRAERSREGAYFYLLKVVLAGVPPPVDLQLQVKVLVDAPRGVAPSLPRRRVEAHAVVAVLLAVYDVDGIAVVLDSTVQRLRFQPRVDRAVHGAVVGLPGAAHVHVGEVLELHGR